MNTICSMFLTGVTLVVSVLYVLYALLALLRKCLQKRREARLRARQTTPTILFKAPEQCLAHSHWARARARAEAAAKQSPANNSLARDAEHFISASRH